MSGVTIKDSVTGRQARVSPDFQLQTQAEFLPLQHYISRTRGQAYQAVFTHTFATAGTKVVGHIKNTSPTLSFVCTFARMQLVGQTGGTAIPSLATYFQLGFGTTYASGGAQHVPININRGSGALADIIAYTDNPTVAGTFIEGDRYYPKDADQFRYDKSGALILGPSDTMSVRLVTDHTAGLAYSRISFLMMDLSE